MHRAATMSPDGKYRWDLTRRWAPGPPNGRYMAWVMLNPSTANHLVDDPTILRCIDFAKQWGFAGLFVYNLMAVRMTDPKRLVLEADPIGDRNAEFLRRTQDLEQCSLVVAAWGAHLAARNLFAARGFPHSDAVVDVLSGIENLRCLGTNKDGSPKHPLYLRRDTPLQPWPQAVHAGSAPPWRQP